MHSKYLNKEQAKLRLQDREQALIIYQQLYQTLQAERGRALAQKAAIEIGPREAQSSAVYTAYQQVYYITTNAMKDLYITMEEVKDVIAHIKQFHQL